MQEIICQECGQKIQYRPLKEIIKKSTYNSVLQYYFDYRFMRINHYDALRLAIKEYALYKQDQHRKGD